MKCPNCDEPEMIEGKLALGQSKMKWFLWGGYGEYDLFFSGDGKDKRVVLPFGVRSKCYLCQSCETFVSQAESKPPGG